MMVRVLVLTMSPSAQSGASVLNALKADGYEVLSAPFPIDAMRLIDSGRACDFLLVDASKENAQDSSALAALVKKVKSENVGLITETGDESWNEFALHVHVGAVMTPSLLKQGLEKWSHYLTDLLTSAPFERESALPHPQCHLEELTGNRFFLAASPAMMQIYRDILILAPVNIPVLILGESGVGKEIVAMLLHKYSPRSDKNLLNINCAALPNDLLESELFGYEAGAFTGATKSKPGLFELAHKGTLLLDEIGEMSPRMQAKLLHVLQDGTFCRLGARSASHVDVRVLAATNINMEEAIAGKQFREDLYYRLNTLTITVPPLRQRREEIPLLMRELFRRGALGLGQPAIFTDRIIEAALDYKWPGNLRELRNFVTRTLILRDELAACAYLRARTKSEHANQPIVELTVEPEIKKSAEKALGMKDAVCVAKNEMEVKMLRSALSASGWNRRRAAADLNISYRTMLYKIQQHGLSA